MVGAYASALRNVLKRCPRSLLESFPLSAPQMMRLLGPWNVATVWSLELRNLHGLVPRRNNLLDLEVGRIPCPPIDVVVAPLLCARQSLELRRPRVMHDRRRSRGLYAE